MGIGNLFRKSGVVYEAATGATTGYSGITSPWSSSTHLAVASLPAGLPEGMVTMAEALSVPPVARAVHLISAVAASIELRLKPRAGAVQIPPADSAPAWLTESIGAITDRHRTALLVQDLFFTGAALLWTNERDADGYPVDLERVPRELWKLNERLMPSLTDGRELNPRNFVYIPALVPLGFLDYGADTVRQYRDLAVQVANRARVGKPTIHLHINDSLSESDAEELEEVIDNFVVARQSKNGAVVVTPRWLDLDELGSDEVSALTEARNAVRLDVANFANVNAALLDGNNGTSDTYSNTLQNMSEFLELTMRPYLTAISARLSQDDVTRPGVTLEFDTSRYDEMTTAKGNAGTATLTTTDTKEQGDESTSEVIN